MLRSTEIKFERAESELSLLLKKNIMHGESSVVSSYCILIIIRQLMSLKFQHKEISNTCIFKHMQLILFVYTLFNGEKRESIKEKVLLKCSEFTFLIDIFEDNHNIERDHFERDSVKVMKNRLLVAIMRRNSNLYQLGSVTSVNHGNCH